MNKFLKNIFNLPMPMNISYFWNFGSMLLLFIIIQIISGLFISFHYSPNTIYSFTNMIHIIQNVNFGWFIHNIHMNGASMFFIFIYLHMARGIFYNSSKLTYTWLSGTSIFILSMSTAFLGYVLPWGQMSFWGATVITNLISTIPFIGINVVEWIWGGYSINNATLNRFFSLHFILPFIISLFIFLHLFFLHSKGSSNPLGLNSNLYKIPFNFYFIIKDIFGFMIIMFPFMFLIFMHPYALSDPDNFTPANPMVTPIHIQPEWYFLFAYAILRSIPNKLGGVIALSMSLTIYYILPFFNHTKLTSFQFYSLNQISFWMFLNIFYFLTWLGAQPIEYPYMLLSQIMTILYFSFFILNFLNSYIWEKLIFIK